MIEILRLSHRIERDKRITTHCALTARAFGATKIYYSGNKDKNLEQSINKTTTQFGGPFKIEYAKQPLKLIKKKKQQDYTIIHLTMYGKPFKKLKNKKQLIIIGSEKVDPEYYKISDQNISISNQPISEVSALGIFLYKMHGIKTKFLNKKLEIIPQSKGKLLKEHKL